MAFPTFNKSNYIILMKMIGKFLHDSLKMIGFNMKICIVFYSCDFTISAKQQNSFDFL